MQLNLGLKVTPDGLSLAFRLLRGNTVDSTMARENREAIRTLLRDARRHHLTILHDRVIATPETPVWYGHHD